MKAWPHIGKMTALERLLLSYSDVTDEGLGAAEQAAGAWRFWIFAGVDVKDPGMAKLAGGEEPAGTEPLRRPIHG